MLSFKYEVKKIEGDYAQLGNLENPEAEWKLVARALLPEEITEGTRLLYEFLEYSIIE